MSGGSFDYLYAKRAKDAIDPNAIAKMAQLLRELRTPSAEVLAMRLEDLSKKLRAVDTDLDSLEEVLRAVEWWQSNDYGPEQVEQACKDWLEDL